MPGSSLPSYDLLGQRKGEGIHIFNNYPDGFGCRCPLGLAYWGKKLLWGIWHFRSLEEKFLQTSFGSFPLPSVPMLPSEDLLWWFPPPLFLWQYHHVPLPSFPRPDHCQVHLAEDQNLVPLEPPENGVPDHTPWSNSGIIQTCRVDRVPYAHQSGLGDLSRHPCFVFDTRNWMRLVVWT